MEAFQHIVWATRKRENFICGEIEMIMHHYIRQRCREMRVEIHALNGMPDHTHIVVTIPTTLATSDFMQRIKGGSSHYINHLPRQKVACIGKKAMACSHSHSVIYRGLFVTWINRNSIMPLGDCLQKWNEPQTGKIYLSPAKREFPASAPIAPIKP